MPRSAAAWASAPLPRRLGRLLICAARTRHRPWVRAQGGTGGLGLRIISSIMAKYSRMLVVKRSGVTNVTHRRGPLPQTIFDEGVSRTSSFATALFIRLECRQKAVDKGGAYTTDTPSRARRHSKFKESLYFPLMDLE